MSAPAWNLTRVTKKIAPHQPGARKLALRYGRAMVCVRHRHNLEGSVRYTTVELVVEEVPIVPRRPRPAKLCVRLGSGEADLRQQVIAAGGRWDAQRRGWWVTRETARRLRLMKRAMPEGPV